MSTKPKDLNARTSIYVLKDPKTQEIRYVGKTTQSLVARLGQHIGDSKKCKNHRAFWIKKIIDSGTLPIIEEIDSCPYEESANLEIYYIAKYKAEGYNLVNDTDGGEGNLGLKQKEESILKRKQTLRSLTPEVYQYDLNGKFIKKWSSAAEAAEKLGFKNNGITRCLRGERFKYKEFIWKTELVDNAAEDYLKSQQLKHERNISKGGNYTQCLLAKIISQESKIINTPWIYIYDKSRNLIFEAISSKDASSYINNKLNRQDIDLASSISRCIKSGTSYYDKFYISEDCPKNYKNVKKKALLIIFDGTDTYYGVKEASEKLQVPKGNIINNIKGKTKTVNTIKGNIKLNWKLNNDFSRLYVKTYGLSTGELEGRAKEELNL